jgi:hypothetical protein
MAVRIGFATSGFTQCRALAESIGGTGVLSVVRASAMLSLERSSGPPAVGVVDGTGPGPCP